MLFCAGQICILQSHSGFAACSEYSVNASGRVRSQKKEKKKAFFVQFTDAVSKEFLTFLWFSILDTVTPESNDSEGVEGLDDDHMSEEMLALVDEFENSWPQEAFEGALEVKGRRMDLQGIRVLKKGAQDGLASSCFGDCGDDDEAEWVSLDQFIKILHQLTVVQGKARTACGF